MTVSPLLYIHGLNSSPASSKARILQAVMQRMGLAGQLRIPALHHHPRQAIAQLQQAIAELGRPLLVGSSLGGYYATFLAEQHGLARVMVQGRHAQLPGDATVFGHLEQLTGLGRGRRAVEAVDIEDAGSHGAGGYKLGGASRKHWHPAQAT